MTPEEQPTVDIVLEHEAAMESLREIITAARNKGADDAVAIYLAAIRDAVKAEREACAAIAATHFGYRDDNSADLAGAIIANRIRERTP